MFKTGLVDMRDRYIICKERRGGNFWGEFKSERRLRRRASDTGNTVLPNRGRQ